MAPKRPSPLDEPPTASSDEEVEESGSESESESAESDSPKLTPVAPTPSRAVAVSEKKAPSKTANSTHQSSSSGSEVSGSETDGESESDSDVGTPKPIASKPVETTTAPKSKQAKPKAAPAPTPAAKSGSKRPSETPEPKDSKKPRKKGSEAAQVDEEPKKLFQRIWCEDDEIAILEGMISYSAKKGSSPNADMAAFLEYIKKSLEVDVNKGQLQDKVRRLNKKYKTCVSKGEKYIPVKAHDAKLFELSKKVWGGGDEGGSSAVNGGLSEQPKSTSGKKSKAADVSAAGGKLDCGIELGESFAAMGLPEAIVKEGLEKIGAAKRGELKDEWRKLQVAELELFVRRTELMRKQTGLVLEAVKSSYH